MEEINMDYQQATEHLLKSYNPEMALERDQTEKDAWKVSERQAFLDLLKQERKRTLLEVGAGTGIDSLFFQENGLHVVCTDLVPAMVELCRAKGLEAYVKDFLNLDFLSASFDALYALNCLLHVPSKDLPAVLEKLHSLLRPGGLFFLGVYGGSEQEGIRENDNYQPPRFFAHHTDDYMKQAVSAFFEIVSFKAIPVEGKDWHFQAMVLRRNE
jgi:SAM-dependent methyltransferase